jgi:anti-sigma factor RsiW
MANHPETELGPYVRGELAPSERLRVARHLEACPDCRLDAEALRALMTELAHSVPVPPAVNWGRYRAELRLKLDARRAPGRAWWSRPLPLALSASLAGVLLFFTVWSGWRSPGGVEPMTPEEATIGRRLDLLRQYSVVERLDLLEEFDVIRSLDQLAGTQEG